MSCLNILAMALAGGILGFYQSVAAEKGFTRKVTLSYNPGCNIRECNTSSLNLIYALAQGPNDSLHYVLSTVGPSAPTVLLLRSEKDAVLKIDWHRFIGLPIDKISGAIRLVSQMHGKEVKASVESVILFDNLLEYNDSTDDATFNWSTQLSPDIALKHLNWSASVNGTKSQLVGSTSYYPKSFAVNSSVSIEFRLFDSVGQSNVLPSLPHNANSTDWELNLDSLLSRRNGSRFAIQALLIGSNSDISKIRTKSINDEYAPAVFTTEKLEWSNTANRTKDAETSTFHQWRTVAYSAADHERKAAIDVKTTEFVNLNESSASYEDVLGNRLLNAYFGSTKLSSLSVRSALISFGQPQDGFYSATNFTSWTSSIGFGRPPADEFSVLIICMLVAGVGCPLIVILLGGVYVAYVRIKRRRGSSNRHLVTNYDYQPIDD